MMKPSIHSESEFQYQAGWSMARAQWINRGHLSPRWILELDLRFFSTYKVIIEITIDRFIVLNA